ncbi:MAG: NlpC/P60 family protein [Fibrobacteraceae bacterium]
MVAACTMPTRTGYDRSIGGYEPKDSAEASSRAASDTSENFSQDTSAELAAWMEVVKPWLGTRYRYHGHTKAGTDCSGYVMSIYEEKTGKGLPHSSRDMFKLGESVDVEDLQPGDLVFFGGHWGIDHVGLYLSGGKFTHSSSSNGVIISPLSDPYWHARYRGARRLSQ